MSFTKEYLEHAMDLPRGPHGRSLGTSKYMNRGEERIKIRLDLWGCKYITNGTWTNLQGTVYFAVLKDSCTQ